MAKMQFCPKADIARRAQKVLTHNGACLRLARGPFGLLLCGHESRKAWGRRVTTGGPSLFQGALTPLELIENATMSDRKPIADRD